MFLAWCFTPGELNGSEVIYKNVIYPFFKKHEKQIDKAMGGVQKLVEGATKDKVEKIQKLVETTTADL